MSNSFNSFLLAKPHSANFGQNWPSVSATWPHCDERWEGSCEVSRVGCWLISLVGFDLLKAVAFRPAKNSVVVAGCFCGAFVGAFCSFGRFSSVWGFGAKGHHTQISTTAFLDPFSPTLRGYITKLGVFNNNIGSSIIYRKIIYFDPLLCIQNSRHVLKYSIKYGESSSKIVIFSNIQHLII